MIKINAAWQVGNTVYTDINKAREAQIQELMDSSVQKCGTSPADIATWIVSNKDKMVDILTTTATSRPRARRINGGTKNRSKNTTTTPAVAEPVSAPVAQSDSASVS